MNYEPDPGTSIDKAVQEALLLAGDCKETVTFDFNGTQIKVDPAISQADNVCAARSALQLPLVERPHHPATAKDALDRWDNGEIITTIEMGGIGPGYEQAIQILVFELIRDYHDKPLPDPKSEAVEKFGNDTVHRIDEKCGGFSGAQVGAARHLAYCALRDGWEKMIMSAPEDRRIVVSKDFPHYP